MGPEVSAVVQRWMRPPFLKFHLRYRNIHAEVHEGLCVPLTSNTVTMEKNIFNGLAEDFVSRGSFSVSGGKHCRGSSLYNVVNFGSYSWLKIEIISCDLKPLRHVLTPHCGEDC